MVSMFGGCSGLESLDVDSFDTANVTYMDNMFSGCSGLTKLELGHFDMVKLSDSSRNKNIFDNCNSLTELHSPINVALDIALPSADNDEKWYIDITGEEVTQLPKGLSKSVKLVRQPQPPEPEPTNPDQPEGGEGGENTPSKPGQQLPNTMVESKIEIHMVVFCVLVGTTACAYAFKQEYDRKESNER